jgi:hypothetical protein
MRKTKAVISADIVNSHLLGKRSFNALLRSLEKILHTQTSLFGFYRGDSFHALCEADAALKIACLLRTKAMQASENEGIEGIDIRMAIGIGKVSEPVKEPGIARDEAYIMSGREVERMGKDGPRLSIRCTDPIADAGMAAIALFTDYILNEMTHKQAEVIHLLLKKKTQEEIAGKLGKSQPTISQHATSAHWTDLSALLKIYENMARLLVHKKKGSV